MMDCCGVLAEGLEAVRLAPHGALWLVIPLLPVGLGAIAILYFQQRRLARRRTVLVLTGIRLLLLLLVAGLFFRPAGLWVHTRTTSGTLWLLVDQSPSMESLDPQAGVMERVHWAEALGDLSGSARDAKVDLVQAHFVGLKRAFEGLRPFPRSGAAASAGAEEKARVAAFAEGVAAWGKWAEQVRKLAEADPGFRGGGGRGASVIDALKRVSEGARSGASAARGAATLGEADGLVNWSMMETNLELAENDLAGLAASTDADFERTHGADPDVAAAIAKVTGVSRSDMAYDFLTANQKRTDRSLQDLLSKYRVRIATFADTAETAGTVDGHNFADTLKSALNAGSPGTAAGQSTNMTAGLQKVAEQIGPDEPASVVIVSDGRHNVPGDPTEAARLLAARGVHVYGLLVGTHKVSADAAVDDVDSPEWVFKGDTMKAGAMLRFDGLAGKTAKVELRRGDVVVDTQTVQIASDQMSRRVDFSDQPPDSAASAEYEVRVEELAGEVNKQNNRSSFRVAVKKDKLYALVIEDRPRWEFRYLAAYLSRDRRLKLQTVLLNPGVVAGIGSPAAVKASPSNPRIEAQILPQTRAEWEGFDFIVLGDLGGNVLTAVQQQYIAAAVRDKGATLVVIAGQRGMPESLANTPLAELLPVTLSPQWSDAEILGHMRGGFRPGLAPEGNGSVLGQLALDAATNGAMWSNIGTWYWHSAYTEAKPSASVEWWITENRESRGGEGANIASGSIAASRKHALMATMPVGLGKVLYLASDQTWRLRQVNGANVQDRFWGQVLRWAVGSDLPAGGKFVQFGANQPRYAQGQPVIITARILHEDLTPYSGLGFSAVARPIKGGKAAGGEALTTEARFEESAETPGFYRATLVGLAPGDVEISLLGSEVQRLLDTDPSVTSKTLVVKIVPQLDLEQRNMNTDGPLLARVAEAGGGYSLDANYADVLASHLPEIQKNETLREEVGFFTDPNARGTWWAHWMFAGVFVLLVTVEWVVRKMAGLV